MAGDTIREFLVSLGFEIDSGSEKKFTNSIGAATAKVVQLGAAAAATAAMVVAGVAKIADSMERMYFISKRTGATVENLQAVGFAAEQMGSSSEAAIAAVENLARLLRNSPGGEGLLKNIGIQTRDASGGLRDTVDMLGDLGERFAAMPYYKANAYAQALGIDEKTLMAMREGMGQFSAEYKEALKAAGVDSQEAAKKSHDFMVQVRSLGSVFGLLAQKITAGLAGSLGGAIERFRTGFLANFGKIADAATKVLLIVFKIGDAIGHMVVRGMQVIGYLIDRWNGLSEGSQTIIKWLGLVLIAWKALSSGFLATPLGRVVALISALALLWDDYQTWKEGGKSLIDWSAWAPGIEKTIEALKWLGNAFHEALGFLGDWRPAFEMLLAYVAGAWLFGMLGAIGKVAGGLATAGAAAAGSLAGKALPVVGAGMAGYAVGSLLYEKGLRNTAAGDAIGAGLAHTLGFLGLQSAKDAVAANNRPRGRPAAPFSAVAQSAAPVASAPVATTPAGAPTVYTGARGLRNNNPGNIEYGPFARSQGATGKEAAGRFAVFDDAQQGLNAIATLIRGKAYAGAGNDSIKKIIEKYAPAKDNNNTAAYIASVAKRMGVGGEDRLNLSDPKIMAGIVDAIVRVENGKNPYSREMIERAGGKPVEINQTTQITVTGADAARQVERAQSSVNDKLVRNMRGAILQ